VDIIVAPPAAPGADRYPGGVAKSSRPVPTAPRGAVVGRDVELARLHGAVAELAVGRGGAVLVEGEPGIGKSELLRAAAAAADVAGCQVFWGAGDPLGTAFPLRSLVDAFAVRESAPEPWRAEVARALRRSAVAAAELLLALVDEVCAARPALLVVDDLQWADEATVGVWHRLAGTVEQRSLLVAGGMRPVPRRDDLKALRRAVDPGRMLGLGPLPAAAVTALVTALAGGAPGERLRALAAGAAGNPLYVTELVAALDRGGALARGASGAEVAGAGAPASLGEAIADRLDFLPGPAREVVEAAALLGEEFSAAGLAAIMHRPVASLLPALADARAAGVLVDVRQALGFRHPLIRAALYDGLPATVRAAWHVEAARALDAAGAPVEAVARQLQAAGPGQAIGDEWLLDWLVDASPVLLNTTAGVAVELLEAATQPGRPRDARQVILSSWLAEGLVQLGRAEDARRLVERALPEADDPDLFVALHRTLSRCHRISLRSDAGLPELDRALATPGLSNGHRARLRIQAGRCHQVRGDIEAAERAARQALAEVGADGDLWVTRSALNDLANLKYERGDALGALKLLDQGDVLVDADAESADLRLETQLIRGTLLRALDRTEEAEAVLRQAQRLADRTGNRLRLARALSSLVRLLYDTGRWDDALAEAGIVEEIWFPWDRDQVEGAAALVALHRGDGATARRHLAAAEPHAERLDDLVAVNVAGYLLMARAQHREQSGALDDALAILRIDAADVQEMEAWLADAVRLAVLKGDVATARQLTGRAEALPSQDVVPHRHGVVLHCQGLLDGDPAALEHAADRYEQAGRPLPRAQALEAAAVLLAGSGEPAAARRHGNAALRAYTALGATWDITRLRGALRARGARLGARAAERTAATGWNALTPTEAKVVGQLAQGRSNPQIAAELTLSRRTVETHVSHILRKLGLTSRVDIIVAVADRDRPGLLRR